MATDPRGDRLRRDFLSACLVLGFLLAPGCGFVAGRARAGESAVTGGTGANPRPPRPSLSASLGWNYLTVADGVSPDYQNLGLRLSAHLHSLGNGPLDLRASLYEKLGLDERSGPASGTNFRTRHQIRTLAVDIAPDGRGGATIGRHRPVTSALGVNDLDGITLRVGRVRGGREFLVFGGLAVEYWEAEFDPQRTAFGAALRVGAPARGTKGELSVLREREESGSFRDRLGVAGRWAGRETSLAGRAEADLGAGLLSYARVLATGKVGRRLSPYVQFGLRRGRLFTDAHGVDPRYPDSAGYRGPVRDVGLGVTWRPRLERSVEGRIRIESGNREAVGADVRVHVDHLQRDLSAQGGLSISQSIWARAVQVLVRVDRSFARGRAGFELTSTAYRWRREGESTAVRWRMSPGLHLAVPLSRAAGLNLTGREILDDRGVFRTEMGIWLAVRSG